MTTDQAAAIARVTEYVRQRSRATGLDPDTIHGVFTDPAAAMAELSLADLRAVLAAATTAPAREYGVAPPPCQHCHWTEGHHRDCPYQEECEACGGIDPDCATCEARK